MGPLEGIKVLDLTAMVSGPVAAMMLADQGADVIKVEPPGGEQMRHMGAGHNGINAMFFTCNRGKRSIAIDMKSDGGKAVLTDLIKDADVFLQNFRPGAIERMGFGEDVVRALNERIIYVSISGFGDKGPYAQKRVYDPVIQALSGATDIQANRETGKPTMFRIIIADKVTALTCAQAVSSALFHRERSGKGQHIRLSMLETMLSFFWPEGMTGLVYAERERDVSKHVVTSDLIFETRTGYITAGTITDREWVGFCKAINREDLADDERFASSMGRTRNAEIRKQLMADELAKWRAGEILQRLDANGVPCAPIVSRMELLDNEQIVANDSILKIVFDGFGEVRQARPAAQFALTPQAPSGPAPQFSEHSAEILTELGYSGARRRELFASGAVTAYVKA